MYQTARPPMVSVTPGRPPFVPNIPVPPYYSQAVPSITAALIMEIQNGCTQNAQRSVLFDTMAYNGFANDSFIGLVNAVFTLAVFYVNTAQAADPNQALDLAFRQTLQTYLAKLAVQYQDIYNAMSPQEREAVNSLLAEYQMLDASIQRYNATASGAGVIPMGGGYPQQTTSYGSYPQQQVAPGGYPQQHRVAGPAARHVAAGLPATVVRNNGGGDAWNRPRAEVAPRVAAPAVETRPAVVEQPKVGVVQSGNATFIQQTWEAMDNWPNLGPGKFPTIVRLGSQVAFFTINNQTQQQGVIVSAIEDCTMEYRLHDNDRYLRPRLAEVARTAPNYAAGDKALDDIDRQKDVKAMLQELESTMADANADLMISGEAINIEEPVLMTTNGDYHTLAQGSIPVPVDLETCTVSMTVAHYYNWEMSDPGIAKLATGMRTAKDYMEMRVILYKLRDNIPYYYWERLEHDITDHMNSLFKYGLGVEIEVDSFCEDLDDAIKAVRGMGEEVFDAFNRAMFLRLRDNGYHIGEAEEIRALRGLPKDAVINPAYGYVEDVTLLPVSSNDLAFSCPAPVGSVNSFHNPAMFAALSARMKARHPRARYLKFITLDNQVFWVHECFLNQSLVVSLNPI